MAHNLATINGKAAFFGTEPAWHKLGQVVDQAQTWEEAMRLAQLDWEVVKTPLLSPYDQSTLRGAYGIFRGDNNTFLGVVGDQYTPIQNRYAFDFVDAILESESTAHYVSAGALGNGEKIWCLAQINSEIDITGTGDVHKYYLLFTTAHDGSGSAICKLTDVRVVCQNTLTQALRMNGEFTRIKHTRQAHARLDAARAMVTGAVEKIHDVEQKLRELSKRIVSKESFTNTLKKLFGDFETSRRTENKVLEVARLYESNDNNTFPEIRGTAYNLLNAVTEYTDHHSGVRQTERRSSMTEGQIRAENAMFGTGAALKESALEVILEMTAGDKRKAEVTRVVMPPVEGKSLLDDIIEEMNNKCIERLGE